MKHTIQKEIEFIKTIQKRAMAKYSQATVWDLQGVQGNLGNLLYETIEDVIISQLQSIQSDVERMKRLNAFLEDGTLQERDNWFYNQALSDVQSIISNRMGENI